MLLENPTHEAYLSDILVPMASGALYEFHVVGTAGTPRPEFARELINSLKPYFENELGPFKKVVLYDAAHNFTEFSAMQEFFGNENFAVAKSERLGLHTDEQTGRGSVHFGYEGEYWTLCMAISVSEIASDEDAQDLLIGFWNATSSFEPLVAVAGEEVELYQQDIRTIIEHGICNTTFGSSRDLAWIDILVVSDKLMRPVDQTLVQMSRQVKGGLFVQVFSPYKRTTEGRKIEQQLIDAYKQEKARLSNLTGQITARIRLFSEAEGGRKGPSLKELRLPMKIEGKDDEYNDCFIRLPEDRPYYPGETFVSDVAFLCPELVADWLKVGMRFKLWERRFIGEGEVLAVHNVK